jgi:acyl dehydratase
MGDPLYYEDVPVGLSFDTGGILVTETHLVQFAGPSGDFFPLHTDDEFARPLGFRGRIAHGLLGLILLDGLKNRASHRFHSVASLAWQWNSRQPIYPGDRIQGHLSVTAKCFRTARTCRWSGRGPAGTIEPWRHARSARKELPARKRTCVRVAGTGGPSVDGWDAIPAERHVAPEAAPPAPL